MFLRKIGLMLLEGISTRLSHDIVISELHLMKYGMLDDWLIDDEWRSLHD